MRDQQPDEYAYDVFISYSHDDAGWVRGTLLGRLEAAGLDVCIDYRDFLAGTPSVEAMERAVEDSHRTVAILTPAYIDSLWSKYEHLMLQTLDPANKKRRLIPVRLKECDIPTRIGYLTYVDFVEQNEADAWTQLLTALGAAPAQKPAEPPTHAGWHLAHPYPMPPNFTGRHAERQMLTNWLNEDDDHPLFVLRALGGFGKSALTWHWLLHDVDPAEWQHVVWWSFYETEAGFERFQRDSLEYLGGDPDGLGPRQQADKILQHLQRHSDTLLVLDGFERELRAYSGMGAVYQGDEPAEDDSSVHQRDCVNIAAEHFLRSVATLPDVRGRVLMTTRMSPSVLERHGDLLQGCREEELTALHPNDAVAFFRGQGIRGSRAEMRRVAERYGYHPLSLRLLAGIIAEDFEQPGDICAADHLDVTGDLKQRRHHVLEQSYAALTPDQQQLLSRIACFRGPVRYEAIRAAGGDAPDLDADLRTLIRRGLLHAVGRDEGTSRYDLHPIVRHYAYNQLSDERRRRTHEDLRDYFAAVPQPDSVQRLEELEPVIELYHHTVHAGEYQEAFELLRDRLVPTPLHFRFGAYELMIELKRALFPDGEGRPPHLAGERDQSWALSALASSYSLSGQPRRAIPLYKTAVNMIEKQGDKRSLAIALGALASIGKIPTGQLHDAEDNLRRMITLGQEAEDKFNETGGHLYLGRLLAYRGAWEESEAHLSAAISYNEQIDDVQGLCLGESYRALRALLLVRAGRMPANAKPLQYARRALELAQETARKRHPLTRDFVRAHWLLGAAHRISGNHSETERQLAEALTRCRNTHLVEMEADILLELAKLRAEQGNREDALRLAEEACTITERSGYVLQGADVHLFLAEMARKDDDTTTALKYARKARELAYCDGPPDYTYTVAFEEAERLLEELGDGG